MARLTATFRQESCELGVASDRQTKSTFEQGFDSDARAIQKLDSAAARWIAADALRELKSDAVQKRLQNRAGAQTKTKSGSEIGKTLSSIECTSGCLVSITMLSFAPMLRVARMAQFVHVCGRYAYIARNTMYAPPSET